MKLEDRYDSLIAWYAQVYGRNPKQVKRQVRMESSFNPRATSSVGACGLGQFMPPTFQEWFPKVFGAIVGDIFDPEQSIGCLCAYMHYLEKRFLTLDLALAAYNYGEGHIARLMVSEPPGERLQHLPAETSAYVAKGMSYDSEQLSLATSPQIG